LQKPGVLGVRAGYKVVGGWPTRKPAIVVTVAQKSDTVTGAQRLPDKVGGIAVDVREASRLKQLELTDPEGYEAIVDQLPAEQRVARFPDEHRPSAIAPAGPPLAPRLAKPRIPYTPPDGVALTSVEDQFTVTCCASPDAGWPVLSQFLSATGGQLTVGLYDFTSAHILAGLQAALAGEQRLDLVLDHPAKNPTADQTDEETHTALANLLGERLRFAWALEGSDRFAAAAIYPNAYHIKVAVRDQDSLWLSSGNWNNSNQPGIDPVTNPADAAAAKDSDRDWHVVIQHPALAQTFAAYLENDLTVALDHQATPNALAPMAALPVALEQRNLTPRAFTRFFAPQTFGEQMRIQPLLTPDPGVYRDAVLQLIQSATQSLYIQTQYAHPSDQPADQAFTDLLAAVAERQQAGVDVRIIFSQWETADYLEKMQAAGFDLAQVRIQQGVHNKGIVRDATDVLISSENWSADGVLRNRDAGVIISHSAIAQYFQQIFLHDWTNLARQQALDA
jgi:phospholipase D-like protein